MCVYICIHVYIIEKYGCVYICVYIYTYNRKILYGEYKELRILN